MSEAVSIAHLFEALENEFVVAAMAIYTLLACIVIIALPSVRTGLPLVRGVLAAVGVIVAGLMVVLGRAAHIRRIGGLEDPDSVVWLVLAGLTVPLAVTLLTRIYHRWTTGETEARYQVTRVDVVLVAVSTLCVWLGFGFSFWAVLLILGLPLAAPYFWQLVSQSVPADEPTDTLAVDRRRVLRMLDEGKVSAAEGAELLNALAHSPDPTVPAVRGLAQRLLLIGVGCVVVGFLLPWFSIDLGREVSQQMRQFEVLRPAGFGQMATSTFDFTTGTNYIVGGDIGRGLGWAILFLAAGAAAVPFALVQLPAATQRGLMLALLGTGGILILYLLSSGWRHISIGLPLVIVGYTLQATSARRPNVPLQAPSASPVAP